MAGLGAVNPFMPKHGSTWNLDLSALGPGAPGFGANNPYLQQFGSPWQNQWISSNTTVETTTSADVGNLPDLQMKAHQADSGSFVFKADDLNRSTLTPERQDGLQKLKDQWAAIVAHRQSVSADKADKAVQHPAIDSFFEWFDRQDKIEFWASVVIFGYYFVHCVLGVV